MQFTLIAAVFASILGLTSAQTLPPTCSLTCFLAAADASDCGLDYDCLCEDATYIASVTACVAAACTAAELTAVADYANTQCAGHPGFPIDL
ncbi:hypothetical protein BZA05DRAFT_387746 [Tricharina praecox]|uniref:uncharacterized protein n=1 Tax=Tricharina praecox TaxID=43433 RepID=UPI002221144E|nr:uncharacterized protein BZA05DRAFT_387746 [Tricharina praecox]KAI5857264.1 hypothetical protein BZA05DRAFT_387746 [Tricharina praecox]